MYVCVWEGGWGGVEAGCTQASQFPRRFMTTITDVYTHSCFEWLFFIRCLFPRGALTYFHIARLF